MKSPRDTEPAPLFRVEGGPRLPDGAAVFLRARSGRRLRVARFQASGIARGSVILSGGRTEPLEKYGEVIGELVGRGFSVLTHDWAGQGLSGRFLADPLRCHLVGGSRAFLEDFDDILTLHAAELPKPWLAVAHSMGGALMALALTQGESRFAAAVLCAPMMEFSAGQLPLWLVELVVRSMNGIGLANQLVRKQDNPRDVAFEHNLLTHDRDTYERTRVLYRAHSELCLGEPTWRWLRFALDIRARLASPGAAERISCPFAVVTAGEDRIVRNEPIRDFVARVPGGRAVEVPGAFHEILMETPALRGEFWRVFDEIADAVAPVA